MPARVCREAERDGRPRLRPKGAEPTSTLVVTTPSSQAVAEGRLSREKLRRLMQRSDTLPLRPPRALDHNTECPLHQGCFDIRTGEPK